MKLSVGLKVANSLSLTPQLQQAIKLLQLSALELEQEIQLQLDSNPLLEKVEDFVRGQASTMDNEGLRKFVLRNIDRLKAGERDLYI